MKPNFCSICKIDFSKFSNLRIHVKKFHPELSDNPIEAKEYHTCDLCDKRFFYLKNLKRHLKIHDSENNNAKIICVLCKDFFSSKSYLHDHLKKKHDVVAISEKLKFNDFNEFLQWKLDMERETKSKFICKSGWFSAQNCEKATFRCHRSGFYLPKGKGKRHLKTQGSNKISGICPAEMSVMKLKDGTVEIQYIKTHVGHTNDLGHLNILEADRQMIAMKIAAKIPFETILDNIRDSICDQKLERTHLLTKKDLFNIEQSFKLNSESVILEISCENKQKKKLSSDKEKFKLQFCQIIDELTTSEEVEVVRKLMAPVRPTLSALKNSIGICLKPSSTSLVPSNKSISQQRLYKTKKNESQKSWETTFYSGCPRVQ